MRVKLKFSVRVCLQSVTIIFPSLGLSDGNVRPEWDRVLYYIKHCDVDYTKTVLYLASERFAETDKSYEGKCSLSMITD